MELTANLQTKKFEYKLVSTKEAVVSRLPCQDKRVAIPSYRYDFGLGHNQAIWLCKHCSLQFAKTDFRLYAIQRAILSKLEIWKEYINKTEPQFLAECQIEERIRNGL